MTAFGEYADDDSASTVKARDYKDATDLVVTRLIEPYAFQPRIARNGRGDMGDCVNALTAQAGETGKGDAAPCVAYAIQERELCVTGDITHTLKAEGFDASEDGTGRGQPIIPAIGFAQNQRDEVRLMEVSGALASEPGMKQTTYVLGNPSPMAVRRLMPVECERLQGFPDGHTAVPTGNKGKPAADGPRYKQLGNSMAVNVMHWIGKRIDAALKVERTGHNGGPAWTIEDMFG